MSETEEETAGPKEPRFAIDQSFSVWKTNSMLGGVTGPLSPTCLLLIKVTKCGAQM